VRVTPQAPPHQANSSPYRTPLVGGIRLPVDAVRVDLEQDRDAVPGAARDLGGRHPGVQATVRLGHEFATAADAEILHEPRLWPEYGPDYYAVFIRDPAGNNLELKCQADVAG
jgi:hypothetical protein